MKPLCAFTHLNNEQVMAVVRKIWILWGALWLGLFTGQALAADWYPVVAAGNVAIFVDKASIKTNGKQKTFMQWQLFGQRIGTTDSAKTRVVFDCANKTRKTEYLIAISQSDTIQSEGKVDDTFKPVIDNSLEATVFQAVCQNKFDGKPQANVNINDVRNFLYFKQAR